MAPRSRHPPVSKGCSKSCALPIRSSSASTVHGGLSWPRGGVTPLCLEPSARPTRQDLMVRSLSDCKSRPDCLCSSVLRRWGEVCTVRLGGSRGRPGRGRVVSSSENPAPVSPVGGGVSLRSKRAGARADQRRGWVGRPLLQAGWIRRGPLLSASATGTVGALPVEAAWTSST